MRHQRWRDSRLGRGDGRERCLRRWVAAALVWLLGCGIASDGLLAQTTADERARAARQRAAAADDTRPPDNRKPVLIRAAVPEYPEEFAGTGLNAEVVVTILVDRMGRASHIRVENSPDPAFTEAVRAALAGFEFLPAIKNGRLTNADMQLTIQVREDIGDKALVDYEGGRIELLATSAGGDAESPVRRLFGPRPAYPLGLVAAGKSGEVVVEFTVGEEGQPRDVRILESTYVEFAQAVEGAIALWRFSPALKGARPVPAALRYRVSFQADDYTEATRAMATRLLAGDTSGLVPAKQLDVEPRARSRILPVAPPGPDDDERVHRAEVAFVVDAQGVVRLPRVLSASDPIAGYAALAAIGYWTFDPALRKKQPVPVIVTMPFRF